MLAKIKDILIIVNKGQLEDYKKLLPDGKNLGIKITYLEQLKPNGLPEAFLIGKNFINKENVALILGDNFFGQSLTSQLKKLSNLKSGAKILLHKVFNPSLYGVAKLNNKNKISLIKEKPKKYISDYAITGLYFLIIKSLIIQKNLDLLKEEKLK